MAKKVLIFTNHFFPENFKINEIAEFLAEEGNEVHVVSGLPNYPSGKIYDGYGLFTKSFERISNNLTIRRLPLIPRGDGSKIRLVINYLTYFFSTLVYTTGLAIFGKKYNVVIVHHTSPVFITISPIIYKWIRGAKMVLWDLDLWPDTLVAVGIIKSRRLQRILEKGMKWIYSRYDYILLGSKGFLEKAAGRIKIERVQYFPNWAEKVFTDFEYRSGSNDLNTDVPFTIAYAGNIGEAQDFNSVFETMYQLRDYEIYWLIIGDGRYKHKLHESVINSGLIEKVKFIGNHPIEKMPEFFYQADAMFLSLKNEEIFKMTVPAKLQAYMASGKPIVAMLSGEGADLIRASNCGFVAESGNSIGFSNAILNLFSQPKSERDRMGENAREFYLQNFDIRNRKKQLLEIVNT